MSKIVEYCDRIGCDCNLPHLPLVHTTEAIRFRAISRKQMLDPKQCSEPDSNVLYYFYGRPAYRAASKIESRTDFTYLPVCLVVKPGAVADLLAVYPFDSGAFHSEAFKEFVHEDMHLDSFLLGNSLDIPPKIIATFFGDNRRYYVGDVKQGLEFGFDDMEAKAYHGIIMSPAESHLDDRRYTIEVQSQSPLIIKPLDIIAVALPRKALEDPQYAKLITKTWGATPLPYDTFRASTPSLYTVTIWQLLKTFYEDQKIF